MFVCKKLFLNKLFYGLIVVVMIVMLYCVVTEILIHHASWKESYVFCLKCCYIVTGSQLQELPGSWGQKLFLEWKCHKESVRDRKVLQKTFHG